MPFRNVTGWYSVPSDASGAGANPPAITVAVGSSALMPTYDDFNIAVYTSRFGLGWVYSWWFASFQICHVVIAPRSNGLVERDPYRAAAAIMNRPYALGSAGRQCASSPDEHPPTRAHGGAYDATPMIESPWARAFSTTRSVARSHRKLSRPSPWMLFQSMSIVVHLAPLAAIAAKSAFCSASDSHSTCTPDARPAREATTEPGTVAAGRLQLCNVGLYCFTQPAATTINAIAAATAASVRHERRRGRRGASEESGCGRYMEAPGRECTYGRPGPNQRVRAASVRTGKVSAGPPAPARRLPARSHAPRASTGPGRAEGAVDDGAHPHHSV